MNSLTLLYAVTGNDRSESLETRSRDGRARPVEKSSFVAPKDGPELYRWGQLLSSTLIRLRSKFDGDFDQYLILTVFLMTELYRQPSEDGSAKRNAFGLNALTIAELTEIPRETVRRKLLTMIDCGYIFRKDNQLYYLSDRYKPDHFLNDLMPLFKHRPVGTECRTQTTLD